MRPRCFIDTGHILAAANSSDAWHKRAAAWTRALQGCYLWTTDYVLLEVLDALSRSPTRAHALGIRAAFLANPRVTVVPQSSHLFERGLEFYRQRLDKDWSLTDCLSFVVMTDLRLTEALTQDHHYEQAGFRALLRSEPPSVNGA